MLNQSDQQQAAEDFLMPGEGEDKSRLLASKEHNARHRVNRTYEHHIATVGRKHFCSLRAHSNIVLASTCSIYRQLRIYWI